MAKINYILRATPAGTPVSGETVTVTEIGVGTLATPSTNASGIATFEQDGSPGPISASATVGSRTVVRDGRSLDQLGTWYANDAPKFWRVFGNGVVPGYTDPDIENEDMQVVPGSGLQVTVSEGVCLIDGHLYGCTADTNLTIAANASGSTRYDRVVVRFTREGQTQEGACELAILQGTPGAGDGAALTKSDATYEFSLAKITVVNAAASFVSGDIADERYSAALNQSYVFTNPNAFDDASTSFRAGDMLYVSSAGKMTRLAKGTDGQVLQLASGIPSWASQTIAVANISDLTATASELNTLDGITANVDELNTLDGITATVAELNYTDGVTSAIQAQLDGKASLSGATFTGSVGFNNGLITTGLSSNGSSTFGSTLAITGATTASGGLVIPAGSKLVVEEANTNPTLTIGSAAGTGGSAAVSWARGGSDVGGQIRIVCGASGVGTGTLVTVTFSVEKADANFLVLFGYSSAAAALAQVSVSSKATTGFTLLANVAPSTGAQIDVDVLIAESPAP